MSDRIRKITRLIDEMSRILLSNNASSLDIKLQYNDSAVEIMFYHYQNTMSDKRLQEINETLNKPHRFELENYYWTLVGETDVDQSLQLLGGLIDKATVERIGSDVSIRLVRETKNE